MEGDGWRREVECGGEEEGRRGGEASLGGEFGGDIEVDVGDGGGGWRGVWVAAGIEWQGDET